MKNPNLPLRKTMCAACPFRKGSKYANLSDTLTQAALQEGRICHSTGSNAINRRTGIKSHLCRGARQVQLSVMAGMGVIEAATDEAWNKKRAEIGMKPTVAKDP